MTVSWKHLAYLLAALPVVVTVFAWIGFFNIGASSGHWKATEWLLHTAMRLAVKTYALVDVEAPPELPRHALQPAAGHYARGCAICHGAPGEARSSAVLRMLPQPPDLAEKVDEWSDAELFWIVRHGVRFTGMPAWPSPVRDDEVWAMVGFLRELPGLDGEAYRRLAYASEQGLVLNPEGRDQALSECARCHGQDGTGGGAATPILAGQSEAYLIESLRAFAEGRRHGGMMALPAQALDAQDMATTARYFAGRAAALGSVEPPMEDAGPAATIIRKGNAARGIPACIGCHGAVAGRNPAYPDIAGQRPDYIANQLRLFRDGRRGGGPFSHLMAAAAKHLTDREIGALAEYLGRRGD